jgi:hypothetical protein
MRSFFTRVASTIYAQIDARDVILVIGLTLLSAGLAQVSVPAAFVAPGAILTYVAVFQGQPKAPIE